MRQPPTDLRLWHRAALGLAVVLFAGWLGAAPADDKGKRTEEEEDDKPAKKATTAKKGADKGKKKRDEEEDAPRGKRPLPKVGDEDEPGRVGAGGAVDLARAAQSAKHPAVKALFGSLAVPHDVVTLRQLSGVSVGGSRPVTKPFRVAPLPAFAKDPATLKGTVKMTEIDASGRRLGTQEARPKQIALLRYYEQIALESVKEFLEQPYSKLDSDNARYLPRADQLAAGEAALSAAVRFHASARERGLRKGEGWEPLEKELRGALLDVLLEELNELARLKQWERAFNLARRVAESYRKPADHAKIARPLADLLQEALRDEKAGDARLSQARARLRMLEEQFPGSKALQPIADSLKRTAEELLRSAKEEAGKKTPEGMRQAKALLRQAEETWPDLPGLRPLRMKIDDEYQDLNVSVRELPVLLSPARAATDSDRRAVELMFESLVRLTPDAAGTLSYTPGLAEGRPRVVSLGREFKLPRNARWSDGRPLTATDLRFTVRLLKDGKIGDRQLKEGNGTDRLPGWGEGLEHVRVGGDPFRVRLNLRQGYLDPLAHLSFKVLPANSPVDSSKFASEPVVSGPFTFGGTRTDPVTRREHALFAANQYYGARPGKLGLPRIREVRMFVAEDPVKDLQTRQVDLALDLTAEQAQAAKEAGLAVPVLEDGWVIPNRRVYFLAINHRRRALANPDVRVALVRAIDREGVLDETFRKGLGRKVHKAINGPYPAGSWACDPKLIGEGKSADPYDPELARARLKQALPKLGLGEVRLTVKYPAGDPTVAAAVKALCAKANRAVPGLKLEGLEQKPGELRKDVEERRMYDLAYYHYDFPDESLWLYPLLGRGEANYLGYDGSLRATIRMATKLRDFAQVRGLAHTIHREFLTAEVPFVPLWQLDPLWAYRKGELQMPPFDPHRVFTDVDQWRVTRPRKGP